MPIIKTFISPVFYREPVNKVDSNQMFELHPLLEAPEGKQTCWLDDLLYGGILIPSGVMGMVNGRLIRGIERPLLCLFAGPPGTGKTTLALEICYRLCTITNPEINCTLKSLYISAESPSRRIIENAKSFGWDYQERCFQAYDDAKKKDSIGGVIIYGSDCVDTKSFAEAGVFFNKVFEDSQQIKWIVGSSIPPDVVVIDGLNLLPSRWNKEDIFMGLINTFGKRPFLLIIILDGYEVDKEHEYWEYLADIAIRLDEEYTEGYYLRNLRIVKAKNQRHAWGKQILKIYGGSSKKEKYVRTEVSPYLKEGGIIVFPSVHRHLREAKEPLPPTNPVETPIKELNEMIGEKFHGFPSSRCTALIGKRGVMKSHLAYYFLLDQLVHEKNAFLISLRDDLQTAITTLMSIDSHQGTNCNINNLVGDGTLEIMDFRPGYIPPSEFYHRILVAIKRRKVDILVWNGVDELSTRFPLCAQENMFVPGLIHLFSANGITSVIISAEGENTPEIPHYGLLPMADLILHFIRLSSKEYNKYTQLVIPDERKKNLEKNASRYIQRVVVQAQRVPAGEIGDKSGLLCRNSETQALEFFRLKIG